MTNSGTPEESIQALQEALKTGSITDVQTVADILLNLGRVHFELEHYDESLDCFRKLCTLQPDNASAWLTRGYILTVCQRYRDAVNALKKALELDPSSPDVCFHLAESLRKEDRFAESLVYYQRMMPLAVEYPQAVHGYAKALLGTGNLDFGWDAMEFRKTYLFGTWEQHHLPDWQGETAENQTVLAYSEEGIAADVMFASCLPDLLNSTERCIVECDASLHHLFQRSFPKAEFVPNGAESAADVQVAFGSLPRFFRKSIGNFPLRKSYLIPDSDKIENWSNRLSQIGGVPKIGFLWSGAQTAETEQQTYLPLFELRNIMTKHSGEAAWVNLQGGSKQKELDAYRRGVSLPIRQFSEVFQYDLDEMAALLVSLDLVITPPGFIAQLAAAVGAKTWLILPERADWRWNLGTENCLWHPFMKMYRKGQKQSWSALFQTLNDDLGEMLKTRRPPLEKTPMTLAFPQKQERDILRRVA
ncbi:MAG: tetratricopeptide repeat protein [Planctomycetaceae bacterium]|jgi:hypothetical protein|nr:tetratricopeptide repeat protein [Planctomycetaceae bacterium]